jgi:hypothetical protein
MGKHWIIAAVAVLSAFGVALSLAAARPAAAQVGDVPTFSPPTSARPRIEVNPRPVYRRCASRYVIQYRPSGTVLFPEKHCWWQRW